MEDRKHSQKQICGFCEFSIGDGKLVYGEWIGVPYLVYTTCQATYEVPEELKVKVAENLLSQEELSLSDILQDITMPPSTFND